VRAYREWLGLSQEAFAAEVMDVSRVYWNRIERGTRNLTLRNGGVHRRAGRHRPGGSTLGTLVVTFAAPRSFC